MDNWRELPESAFPALVVYNVNDSNSNGGNGSSLDRASSTLPRNLSLRAAVGADAAATADELDPKCVWSTDLIPR